MKLGHCICDPRKPCPCDLLKEKDVCLCAGERLEQERGPVRLTRLVESAGCASKVDQATLKRIVGQLPDIECPQVLVGAPAGDDAGVYELEDGRTIIQTVDVFAPSVDDPYMFGEVAAANSVSDVYAMGARPLTALSIIGFPVRTVADDVMRDILRGRTTRGGRGRRRPPHAGARLRPQHPFAFPVAPGDRDHRCCVDTHALPVPVIP